jgi:hypothetical protein
LSWGRAEDVRGSFADVLRAVAVSRLLDEPAHIRPVDRPGEDASEDRQPDLIGLVPEEGQFGRLEDPTPNVSEAQSEDRLDPDGRRFIV